MRRPVFHSRRTTRRRYLRPERDRGVKRSAPRQPNIRPPRHSLSGMLNFSEAPEGRPDRRLQVVVAVVFVVFGLMVLRLWTLQVIDSATYTQAAVDDQIHDVSIPAPRGLIVGRDGTVMVGNTVTYDITLSQQAARQNPTVVGALAALVGETPAQVLSAVDNVQNSPYEPVPVLDHAPFADVQYIEEHLSEFPGVSAQRDTERAYPLGESAVALDGYVSSISADELKALAGEGYQQGDQIGQSGLEYEYEPYLKGTPGEDSLEVNAQGLVQGTAGVTQPVSGDNVITNIDPGLQEVADQAMAAVAKQDRNTFNPVLGAYPPATDGAVVVLDPNTGAVEAMASYPSYDPTWWVGGISSSHYDELSTQSGNPLINHATQSLYTPGSTFKVATATADLQDGLWPADEYYDDTGTFAIPDCTGGGCSFHDDEGEVNGEIDLPEALELSSNVFFAHIGYLFNQQSPGGGSQIAAVANEYGYGVSTGVDLPNDEASSRVDSAAERQRLHQESPTGFPYAGWEPGDAANAAFGQGETIITPLQQAVAYATFVNGGTRYAPEVAAAIETPHGKVVKRFTPKVEGHVSLPPSVSGPILEGFTDVVQQPGGTAHGAFQGFPLSQFPIAGKTGTATATGQVATSWFIGFGPLPDPQYVVVAVLDQGGYGADAAAPIVRQVFQYLLAHPVGPVQLGVPETTTSTTGTGTGAGTSTSTTGTGTGAGTSTSTTGTATGTSATGTSTSTSTTSTAGGGATTTSSAAGG